MKAVKLKQETYAAELFLPVGATNKSCLFAPGFPYSLVANDAIAWMTEHGYTVLFPQPPGSYDSNGNYTPMNHVRLLSQAAEDMFEGRLTHAKSGASLPALPRPDGIIAHSFGTVSAADYAAGASPRWALLFAPILGYSSSAPDFGVREDLATQIDYVARSRPFTFRLGDRAEIMNQSLSGQGRQATEDHGVNVIGVVGEDDDTFDVRVLAGDWGSLVQQRIGPRATARLHIVQGAGHGITELLTTEVTEALEDFV